MEKKNIKEAEEQLKRVLLMMKYDSSKTLSENKTVLSEQSREDERDRVKKILERCKTITIPNITTANKNIADKFSESFKFFLGSEWGTKTKLWKAALKELGDGNLSDLCQVNKYYNDSYGGDGTFLNHLYGDLSAKELTEIVRVFENMSQRDSDNNSGVSNTESNNLEWWKNKFPCVFNSGSVVNNKVYQYNGLHHLYIVGTSNNKYYLFDDGVLFNAKTIRTPAKNTGRKLVCKDRYTPIVEGQTKKITIKEQFDDSSLIQGSVSNINKGGNQTTNPPKTNRYRYCAGTSADPYMKGCMDKDQNGDIHKVQGCLGGIPVDGKFWVKTEAKLKDVKGISSFTKNDVDSICNKNQTTTTTTLKPITLPTPEGGEDIHTLNQ